MPKRAAWKMTVNVCRRNGRFKLSHLCFTLLQLGFRLEMAAFTLEIRSRHDAQHEFSEQRHSEFDIAVGRTVDHSFVDQAIAQRRDRLQLHPKEFGNVAGALWTSA